MQVSSGSNYMHGDGESRLHCTERLADEKRKLVNIMALLRSEASAGDMNKIVEDFLEEVTQVSLILFKVSGSPLVH